MPPRTDSHSPNADAIGSVHDLFVLHQGAASRSSNGNNTGTPRKITPFFGFFGGVEQNPPAQTSWSPSLLLHHRHLAAVRIEQTLFTWLSFDAGVVLVSTNQ